MYKAATILRFPYGQILAIATAETYYCMHGKHKHVLVGTDRNLPKAALAESKHKKPKYPETQNISIVLSQSRYTSGQTPQDTQNLRVHKINPE